jgi:mgtE-like transporter
MIYSMKTILKESFPMLLVAGAISICAGLILHSNGELLFTLPGILAIIPSFNNMGGSVTSVLCCRLSSALHLGTINPKLKKTKTLERNIFATLIITTVSFFALGLAAGGFNMLLGLRSLSILAFPLVTLAAGFVTVAILSALSVIFSYISYNRGIDPDNWVIPILTSIGDFVGVSLLFLILTLVI